MKLTIEIAQNHPALLHFNMIQKDLEARVSETRTPRELINTLTTAFTDSDYFFGCGANHLWIHHKADPGSRIAIVYFSQEPGQGWTWNKIK